ncbi:MAG TPA: hypothetical protein PK736_10440, partial [Bacteroidia bacterium]|nr:hypothetical protein [Bacteroidia bacterium]
MKNKLFKIFVLFIFTTMQCKSQTAFTYPGSNIQNVDWNSWSAHTINYAVPGKVTATPLPAQPVYIHETAKVDITSSTEVHMADGF